MKSSFQFADPILTKLHFDINKDGLEHNSDSEQVEVSTQIGFKISVGRSKSDSKAFVELEANISLVDNDSNILYTLITTMGAEFKWSEEYDEKKLDALLTINAPSLLLSYLRPVVASVTNSSQFPTCNIPFINFNDKENITIVEDIEE